MPTHEPRPRTGKKATAGASTPTRDLAREVLIHGPIARSDLGRRLGLSPASLTRLSKPLLDGGFLVETAENTGGSVGRPTRPLDVQVSSSWYVGIKLTGDQALGVGTDLRASVLAEADAPLLGHTPDQIVDAVARIVEQLTPLAGGSAPAAVGIAIGGNVDRSGVVIRAPFLDWRDVDLRAALEDELDLPVVVENDVVALTEAEHWFGLGRGLDDFAVITVGAGVGYGLVVHGAQMRTADTGLGLGGHFPLDPDGPACFLGHRGCSTAMLAIPSVSATVSAQLSREVSYEDALALAGAGDPAARAVLERAGRALGQLIAAVANLTMVTTVVLAGEGIGLERVARPAMQAALSADRDPEASAVDVRVGSSDFGAWARGAAAVAIQSRLMLSR